MAVTTIGAEPFILEHPYLLIGDTTSGVEIHCGSNNVDVNVDQDENTVETFCGEYTSYKAEKWTITITVAMSYGTDGVWNQLRPLVGTEVPFEIRPDGDLPAAADNPSFTGTARVKAFPFISGGVGEASEVDVVLAVQGEPVVDYGTGTTTAEAA